MFSADKLVVRLNKIFRNLLFHLIFWYLSFLFYTFLTGDDLFFKTYLNFLGKNNIHLVILVLSGFIDALFTLFDGIFSDRVLRFFPRRLMIFSKSLLYFASAFILLIIAINPPLKHFTEPHYEKILHQMPPLDIHFLRFLIYFYLSSFLINFLKGVMKKFGRGNFKSWILGMLNKPMEQERIFMFIDMKSSTSIAEKLNHKKYSHLIQDVFNDMSIIDNYQGHIYQYLGDGAIITWRLKEGLRGDVYLRAFYAFTRMIQKRRRYYKRKYGIVPNFKAGVHAGKVMVLQVGRIRRDISYNGDALNTAARIESLCNEYKQNLLISGDLYKRMKDQEDFNIKKVGNIKLKGKRKGVDIYQVKKKKNHT